MWTSRLVVAARVIAMAAAMVLATEEQIIAQALNFDERPFIWDAQRGMRNLETVLIEDFSLDLTGWVLTRATGVSADGSAIIGLGSNPQGHREGWIARLGETSATFQGLGDLPGGGFWTDPLGISGDGTIVVGRVSSSLGLEAFRWTQESGMETLGFLPGATGSIARAISTDGQFIVGSSNGPTAATAFRWSEDEGMIPLGHLSGTRPISGATAVSADGSVVVGGAEPASIPPGQFSANEAFRWTEEGGMVGLGDLPGGRLFSAAQGVSGDGSQIVGIGNDENERNTAFLWTLAGGYVPIRELHPNAITEAFAISADGTTVVGKSSTFAFRWTEIEGMVDLGLAFEFRASGAMAISDDGSVIVGYGLMPEPSTLALLGGGAIALLRRRAIR